MAVRDQIKVATLTLLVCLLAFPQISEGSVGPREIESKLREAKILPASEKLATVLNGDQVIVYKFYPKASLNPEQDCKIDAVLISKIVISAFPQASKVRVRFVDLSDFTKYTEIAVGFSVLQSFSSGTITQEQLFKELDMLRGEEPKPPAPFAAGTTNGGSDPAVSSVLEGPLQAERAALQNEIHSLELQKVNITAYKSEFARLEDLAKKNDKEGTRDLLDRLNLSVSDQLKAIANRSKRVPLAHQTSTSSAPSSSSVNTSTDTSPADTDPRALKMKQMMELVLGGGSALDQKQILYTMGKAHYGDLAASPGDFENERSLISRVIIYKRDNLHRNVDDCVPRFKELNAYAENHAKDKAIKAINQFYQYLHISADLVAEWKAYKDPVKAWHGVHMSKYFGGYEY